MQTKAVAKQIEDFFADNPELLTAMALVYKQEQEMLKGMTIPERIAYLIKKDIEEKLMVYGCIVIEDNAAYFESMKKQAESV